MSASQGRPLCALRGPSGGQRAQPSSSALRDLEDTSQRKFPQSEPTQARWCQVPRDEGALWVVGVFGLSVIKGGWESG